MPGVGLVGRGLDGAASTGALFSWLGSSGRHKRGCLFKRRCPQLALETVPWCLPDTDCPTRSHRGRLNAMHAVQSRFGEHCDANVAQLTANAHGACSQHRGRMEGMEDGRPQESAQRSGGRHAGWSEEKDAKRREEREPTLQLLQLRPGESDGPELWASTSSELTAMLCTAMGGYAARPGLRGRARGASLEVVTLLYSRTLSCQTGHTTSTKHTRHMTYVP